MPLALASVAWFVSVGDAVGVDGEGEGDAERWISSFAPAMGGVAAGVDGVITLRDLPSMSKSSQVNL
jgi:hypothetical protein